MEGAQKQLGNSPVGVAFSTFDTVFLMTSITIKLPPIPGVNWFLQAAKGGLVLSLMNKLIHQLEEHHF